MQALPPAPSLCLRVFSSVLCAQLFPILLAPPGQPHFNPFPIPPGPGSLGRRRDHMEGIQVSISLQVTHARKMLGLGLNDLHFSMSELTSNCIWADLARNGLNDQLEGKTEFLSLKFKGHC